MSLGLDVGMHLRRLHASPWTWTLLLKRMWGGLHYVRVFVVLISIQPDLSNENVDCDSSERLKKTLCTMCVSCCCITVAAIVKL